MTDNTNSTDGLVARQAALFILTSVLRDGLMLSSLREHDRIRGLEGPDAARALSLATNVMRFLGRIDTVINKTVDKNPSAELRNILRLIGAELWIDKIPAHAAIHSGVEIAKSSKATRRGAGLVNWAGHRFAETGQALFNETEAQKLPKSIRHRLVKTYGEGRVREFEIAHEKNPAIDIFPKSDQARTELLQRLDVRALPTGGLRLNSRVQVSAIDGYEEGAFWVQDAAATLPVLCFGDMQSKRVLDLCAAPGGKSMQLAALGAEVTAVDNSASRLKRLDENLERTKLSARSICADATEFLDDVGFDGVLADVPCSASGTIRRHPDLVLLKGAMQLKGLVGLQRRILTKAAENLKLGGTLVFSTCSLFKEEGEDQLDWIASNLPQLRQVTIDPTSLGLDQGFSVANGAIRTTPEQWNEIGGMDGFFLAKFERIA